MRAAGLRVARRLGFAALIDRFAAGLAAPDERLAPVVDDLERADVAFFAGARFAVERLAVARFAPVLRAPVERAEPVEAPPLPMLAPPSTVHLPDITRCAASATASAIKEPSFVALAIILLAACEAVSAASSPASRIARLALGLALIAAAAAARPAANISLLIAPFASLSTVLSPEPDEEAEDDLEDVFRADFAIALSPWVFGKRQLTAVTVPKRSRKCGYVEGRATGKPADMLKGTAAYRSDALRHGQRPEMWPFVSD